MHLISITMGPAYNEKFILKLMYWYVVDFLTCLSSDITVTNYSDVSVTVFQFCFHGHMRVDFKEDDQPVIA